MTVWITLAMIAAVALIAVVVIALVGFHDGKALSQKTFVCGECGKEFSPNRWTAGFSAHMGENVVLKCPHCEKRSFCPPTYKDS